MKIASLTQLGEFTLIEKLGQGAMGTVYKARQTSLNRIVALKLLSAHYASDPEFLTRFKNESAAAASLNHSNIVQVYAAGEDEGTHYYAMEYVEGETLGARLDRKGRLAPREALAIACHLAQALHYAWKKARVIHRDIKPDNIFLSHEGAVKLGDLGLAKMLGNQAGGPTQTGTTMGTPHYVSPEQAMGTSEVDFRADIYSLGCTIYHAVAGAPPYRGESAMSVMLQHVSQPAPKIQDAWPACPSPLIDLLGVMLRKRPAERHESYEALLQQLLSVADRLNHPASGAEAAAVRLVPMPATHSRSTPDATREAATGARRTPARRTGMGGTGKTLAILSTIAVMVIASLAWHPWKSLAPLPAGGAAPAGNAATGPAAATTSTNAALTSGAVHPVPALNGEDNTLTPAEVAEGWKLLFNGKDLTGWKGSAEVWSVEQGAIAQTARGEKTQRNDLHLIWQGGRISDFEITYKVKAQPADPSKGMRAFFLFRDELEQSGDTLNARYLQDISTNPFTGGPWVQWGWGKKIRFWDGGEPKKSTQTQMEPMIEPKEMDDVFKVKDWNEYRILAVGSHIRFFAAGKEVCDVLDETSDAPKAGYFGFKIAQGSGPGVLLFKDIKLKELSASSSRQLAAITSPVRNENTPPPPVMTGPGQLKVFSDQFLNAREWVLARLDLAVPGTIADKISALKAALTTESALNAGDKDAQGFYKVAIGLCDALTGTLRLREQALGQAGGSAARAPNAGGIQRWDHNAKIYREQLGAAYAKFAASLAARGAKPFIISQNAPTILFPPLAAPPIPAVGLTPAPIPTAEEDALKTALLSHAWSWKGVGSESFPWKEVVFWRDGTMTTSTPVKARWNIGGSRSVRLQFDNGGRLSLTFHFGFDYFTGCRDDGKEIVNGWVEHK